MADTSASASPLSGVGSAAAGASASAAGSPAASIRSHPSYRRPQSAGATQRSPAAAAAARERLVLTADATPIATLQQQQERMRQQLAAVARSADDLASPTFPATSMEAMIMGSTSAGTRRRIDDSALLVCAAAPMHVRALSPTRSSPIAASMQFGGYYSAPTTPQLSRSMSFQMARGFAMRQQQQQALGGDASPQSDAAHGDDAMRMQSSMSTFSSPAAPADVRRLLMRPRSAASMRSAPAAPYKRPDFNESLQPNMRDRSPGPIYSPNHAAVKPSLTVPAIGKRTGRLKEEAVFATRFGNTRPLDRYYDVNDAPVRPAVRGPSFHKPRSAVRTCVWPM